MAGNLVTLVLNGDPTLADLTTALEGLQAMLKGLEADVAPGAHISWKIDSLERSSARVGVAGFADTPFTVESVAEAYLLAGRLLGRSPVAELPYKSARKGARTILGVINGSVPSVRFETTEDDATVTALPRPQLTPEVAELAEGAYGAVQGRIQTASMRNGLRFTLYDLVEDKSVTCYPGTDQEDVVRGAWGHIAVVEGWVKRDPATQRPVTIRRVSNVTVLPEVAPGSWRRAEGVLRGLVRDEAPEATIRRIRAK